MTFDDLLKQLVQTQRKQASAVLYGGDLKDNTTLSFTEQKYEEKPVSNKAPNIFNTYGSSITDRDDRMFMMPQPQVPSNPELEALNDYFNQRRVEQFARASAGMIVGETIQKQAEQTASAVVKDEMDRRAGIRRAVLERTGLTPGQIQQQMVSESLAGVNPRALDMRDQQIQDAVNQYYNINNIPAPVTTPMANPVPATTPSGTIAEPEIPATTIPEPETAPAPEIPVAEPEDNLERAPEELTPEEPAAFPSELLINTANVDKLVDYIYEFNVFQRGITATQSGDRLIAKGQLRKRGKPILQSALLDELYRRQGRAGVNRPARGSLMQEPSAAPKTEGLSDDW
jgi:hypothetical protein